MPGWFSPEIKPCDRSIEAKVMIPEKRKTSPECLTFVFILLLVLMVGSAGCIKIAKNALNEGSTVGGSSSPQMTIPQSAPPANPVAVMTQSKSDVITEVTPYLTPDPYVLPQATQINETPPQTSFQYRQPEFTKAYKLTGNAAGLMVNVVQGPLYIVYTVNPQYDCLMNPESCRGTVLATVNRPYMTITVRNNQTNEIVAEDGYGRQYSSDTGAYTFTNNGYLSTSFNGNTTVTSVSLPGPRYIPIYSGGQFQVTIQGNYLSITVSIITGTSSNPLNQTETSGGTASE